MPTRLNRGAVRGTGATARKAECSGGMIEANGAELWAISVSNLLQPLECSHGRWAIFLYGALGVRYGAMGPSGCDYFESKVFVGSKPGVLFADGTLSAGASYWTVPASCASANSSRLICRCWCSSTGVGALHAARCLESEREHLVRESTWLWLCSLAGGALVVESSSL